MFLRSRKATDLLVSQELQLDRLNPEGDGKPLLQQKTPSIKGWPTAPRAVKTSLATHVLTVLIDTVLLIASVAFLAFAIALRRYDQAAISEHLMANAILQAAAKVGPSVFPILFAAAVGRAAQAVLLWRLEIGEQAGVLDLLAGSTSLTSTVTSQLQLRTFNILGAVLLALWALSPVGGQASIRQLVTPTGNGTYGEPINVTYMRNTRDTSAYGNTNRGTLPDIVNSLFLSALLAPAATKNSPVDLWNNVKIPKIEMYESSIDADSEGWFDTNSTPPLYSSLLGTPVVGYESHPDVDYSVNIDTSYLHLDCPAGEPYSDKGVGSFFSGSGSRIYLNYNASCGNEETGAETVCEPPNGLWKDDQGLTNFSFINGFDHTTPTNFTYATVGPYAELRLCKITTTYVEVEVVCRSLLPCAVTRLRRSRLHQPQPAVTVLHYAGGWFNEVAGNLGFFFNAFVGVMYGHVGYSTAVQGYLTFPENPMQTYTLPDDHYQGPSVSNETFALRLGQLMNAYWTCLTNFYTIPTGTLNTTFLGGTLTANTSTTTGTKTTHFEIIACNQVWSIILIIVSSILIIACLIHPIIDYALRQGPDFLLNFSSLAMRDSPYVAVPDGGSTLDAADRANLLKHVEVRFGDVEAHEEVGRLAISSAREAEGNGVGRVRKGRLYR